MPCLAQPLNDLEAAICGWATQLGHGTIYNAQQFERLCAMAQAGGVNEDIRWDLGVAHGALRALRLRPVNGWDGYLEIWSLVKLEHAIKVYHKAPHARIRTLEERLGGIAIGSRSVPLMLVLPQPQGTYVQMGWDSVTEVDRSPLGNDRDNARVLRDYVVPEDQRVFQAPASEFS